MVTRLIHRAKHVVEVLVVASLVMDGPAAAGPPPEVFPPGSGDGRAWRLEATHARPWPGLELRRDELALRFPLAAERWLELRVGQWTAGPWREQWAEVGVLRLPALGLRWGAVFGGEVAAWSGSPELRSARVRAELGWSTGPWSLRATWWQSPGREPARPGLLALAQWRAQGTTVRLERYASRWGGQPRWLARWSAAIGPAQLGLGLGHDDGALRLGLGRGTWQLGLRWELLGVRAGGSELALRWAP